MLFKIYRSGFHPKNQPESAGGPETVLVAEVNAQNEGEAVEKALLSGVTWYPGQKVWAEKA